MILINTDSVEVQRKLLFPASLLPNLGLRTDRGIGVIGYLHILHCAGLNPTMQISLPARLPSSSAMNWIACCSILPLSRYCF